MILKLLTKVNVSQIKRALTSDWASFASLTNGSFDTRHPVKIRKWILQRTSIEVELDEQDFSIKEAVKVPVLQTSDFFNMIYSWFVIRHQYTWIDQAARRLPLWTAKATWLQPAHQVLVFIRSGLLLPLNWTPTAELCSLPTPCNFMCNFDGVEIQITSSN